MKVVVDSFTGLSWRFASHLKYDCIKIADIDLANFDEKFFLVTRCYGFGEIPDSTIKLLRRYYLNCVGVAVSGNRNWGSNYCIVGDKIENIYNIPCVCKFEGSGFSKDWQKVNEFIDGVVTNARK